MRNEILFEQLPVGARFEFRGRRYQKMNTALALDEDRYGNNFHLSTTVFAECATLAPSFHLSHSSHWSHLPRRNQAKAGQPSSHPLVPKLQPRLPIPKSTPLPYNRKTQIRQWGARVRFWIDDCTQIPQPSTLNHQPQ